MDIQRVAIVTGASAGIGEAVAKSFLQNGYKVVVNARREEKLTKIFAPYYDKVTMVSGDASDEKTIEKLFSNALQSFGKEADIVVANAGRGLGGSVVSANLEDLEKTIQINLTGAIKLLQIASQRMLKDLESHPYPKYPHDIVVLGSTVGRHVSPFSAVYGATKFGVNSLAEALRREIGPKGIRVSLLEPGIVLSEFQAVAGYNDELMKSFHDRFGPIIGPDDVARTIQFIVSQPPQVHINDVMIRATRQDYP